MKCRKLSLVPSLVSALFSLASVNAFSKAPQADALKPVAVVPTAAEGSGDPLAAPASLGDDAQKNGVPSKTDVTVTAKESGGGDVENGSPDNSPDPLSNYDLTTLCGTIAKIDDGKGPVPHEIEEDMKTARDLPTYLADDSRVFCFDPKTGHVYTSLLSKLAGATAAAADQVTGAKIPGDNPPASPISETGKPAAVTR